MTSVTLLIKVKPNARASSLEQEDDGTWSARLKARPIGGKANDELIALVAEHFRCRKNEVLIRSGISSRLKVIKVDAH